MKRIKRIAAVAAASILALALLGCGGNKEEAKRMLEEAQQKMADVKSMEITMNMDMDMELLGQKMVMNMGGNMSMINAPVQMKLDMKVDAGEGAQQVQLYAKQEGDVITMYSGAGSAWTKQELTVPEFEKQIAQYDANQSVEQYIEMFSDIKMGKNESFNGKDCTRIIGIISGDQLRDALNMAGNTGLENLEDSGMSSEDIKGLFEGVDDLEMSIWIDNESGCIVGYEMDMSKLLEQVFQNLMKKMSESSGMSIEVKINKMRIEMAIENIDGVEEIVIPQDALNAPEE